MTSGRLPLRGPQDRSRREPSLVKGRRYVYRTPAKGTWRGGAVLIKLTQLRKDKRDKV